MKVRTRRALTANKTSKRRASGLRVDPTRTAMLRKKFVASLRRRFGALKADILRLVIDGDAFGLKGKHITTNTPNWRFQSDPEKVRAFQQWLRTQVSKRLRGLEEEKLWDAYIRQAYERGQGRAYDDVTRAERGTGRENLDFYRGGRRQFLADSFRQPASADKVKVLAGRSFDDLEGVTSEMSTRITRSLVDGMIHGQNPREIAREMSEDVDVGRSRAELIARTEIIRAHAEGQLDSMERLGVQDVGVQVEWSTAGDLRVCPECEDMEGTVLSIEDAHGMIPRHPNCLPGNSLVLACNGITAASKRFYYGNLVILQTTSNRKLSCTPNHPILTNRGWVSASLLNIGDKVVCDGGREWVSAVYHNSENVPTFIHDIAEAFFSSRNMTTVKVPTSAPDFHGDGGGSKVAVIGTNRQLRGRFNISFVKEFLKSQFIIANTGTVPLFRRGVQDFLRECSLSSNASEFSRSGLLSSLRQSFLRTLKEFGFTLPSTMNSVFDENPANSTSSYIKALSNSILRITSNVTSNDFVFGEVHGVSDGSILRTENSDNDFVRDAKLARKLTSGDAGPVFLDEIVSLTIQRWSGHVYNLETNGGFYSAEGIITHNCRCAWLPSGVGERTENRGHYTHNAFCPTGPGGGVDPTCGGKGTVVEQGILALHDKMTGRGGGKLVELVKANYAKLPPPVRAVVGAGVRVAFAGWTASQALAEGIAREQGLSEADAAKLRATLIAADLAAFKPAAVGLAMAGPVASALSWAVPPVTGAYLLTSLATSPVKTYKAAHKLVNEFLDAHTDVLNTRAAHA